MGNKRNIIVLFLLGIFCCSCKLNVDVKNVEKKDLYAFTEADFSHCFNSIKLKWKNPESSSLDSIKLSYNGKVEIFNQVVPGEEMSVVVENLEACGNYAFYLEAFNSSAGVIASSIITGYTGHAKTEGTNTSIYNYHPGSKTGTTFKYISEGNRYGVTYSAAAINEVVVVCPNTKVIVNMEDNCSFDSYVNGENPPFVLTGGFTSEETVTLNPYSITTYEISSLDFSIIKGTAGVVSNYDSLSSSRKTGLTYLEVIEFANSLTKATLGEKECCYYADKEFKTIYSNTKSPYFYYKKDAKGYRLPTRLEWEYAARGGNPNSVEWGYAYSGANVGVGMKFDSENYLEDFQEDSNLLTLIKSKTVNALGIASMSGDVSELTLDYFSFDAYEHTYRNVVGDTNPDYYRVGSVGGWSGSNVPRYKFLNSCNEALVDYVIVSGTSISESLSLEIKNSAAKTRGFRLVRSL